MRVRFSLSIELGPADPEPVEQHDSDHTGHLADAGTAIGFSRSEGDADE